MAEYLETVVAFMRVAGWSWFRAALFVAEYGVRFAKVSMSAQEGVVERALGVEW